MEDSGRDESARPPEVAAGAGTEFPSALKTTPSPGLNCVLCAECQTQQTGILYWDRGERKGGLCGAVGEKGWSHGSRRSSSTPGSHRRHPKWKNQKQGTRGTNCKIINHRRSRFFHSNTTPPSLGGWPLLMLGCRAGETQPPRGCPTSLPLLTLDLTQGRNRYLVLQYWKLSVVLIRIRRESGCLGEAAAPGWRGRGPGGLCSALNSVASLGF